ncbi:MAG: sugar transferase [Candidatus Omnitrophica bacterium]|nr:sugar transferase [Candidatus Omnitrophota bacterium]
MPYEFFKRAFDIIASVAGLILLSPVLLFVATLIKLEDGRPVFYRSVRIGRYGVPFAMYKFRTMIEDAETQGASSTSVDDPRITGIGRFLRRYKIDEIPQLINVFKGDMSLVGPRPQVKWAVDMYDNEQKKLLSVRPGITDYASLKFSDEGEILKGSDDPDRAYLEKIAPEKIRLGLEYVANKSLMIDLKILLMTLKTLFVRNINQAGD